LAATLQNLILQKQTKDGNQTYFKLPSIASPLFAFVTVRPLPDHVEAFCKKIRFPVPGDLLRFYQSS